MTQQHTSLTASAAAFAARAHDGQFRTGTKFPYSTHPLGVGQLLREYYPSKPELEAAGYLHDVVEDTKYTYMDIRDRFGDRVALLVDGVTSRSPDWRGGPNKDITWSIEDRMKDPDVARLKSADVLDNVRDTIRGLEKGHDVWSRFRAGTRKAEYWRKISNVADSVIAGEPLSADLRAAVTMVESLRDPQPIEKLP